MTEETPDQTSTEVAVVQQPQTVAVREKNTAMLEKATDSWWEMARPLFWLAEQISDTEFVPKGFRGNAPAAAAAMLHGRELGLPPMTALAIQHSIEGRTGLSAEGMRSLVFEAGHEIEFLESTGAICRIRGRRKGSQTWTEVGWTMAMASAAGLAGKTNWKNHPRRMLQARASSELCQMIFPDVLHGMASAEEIEDGVYNDDAGIAAPADPTANTTKVARAQKRTTAASPEVSAAPPPQRQQIALPAPRGRTEPDPEPSDDEQPPPAAGVAPDESRLNSKPSTPGQWRLIPILFQQFGVTEDAERHYYTGVLSGRRQNVESTKDLSTREASQVIDTLQNLIKTVPVQGEENPPVDLCRKALEERTAAIEGQQP